MKKSFLLVLLLCVVQWSLMATKIEGRVVNSKGEGLSYVSLYLKHYPEVGTISDINGRFSLEVPSTRDSLIVTLVGYETMFINLSKVNTDKSLRITMKDQPVILNEVVVHVQKDSKKKKSKKEERAEIQAFLQKVYNQIFSRKLPQDIQHVALRKLIMIDNAQSVEDLRVPPGNHLEELHGDREGQYSIKINDQYRICFRANGNRFCDVEIVDYH